MPAGNGNAATSTANGSIGSITTVRASTAIYLTPIPAKQYIAR